MAGVNISIDALNTVTTTPVHELGQTVEVGGVRYRYVYNTGSTSVTAYWPVYMAATSTYYINGTTGSGIRAIAGFAHTAIGSAEYGWAAIDGMHTGYAMAAVATVGWPLACGATPGVNTYTQASDRPIGWAAQVTTAAGTFVMYVEV